MPSSVHLINSQELRVQETADEIEELWTAAKDGNGIVYLTDTTTERVNGIPWGAIVRWVETPP